MTNAKNFTYTAFPFTYEREATETRAFGVFDAKGREIGAFALLATATAATVGVERVALSAGHAERAAALQAEQAGTVRFEFTPSATRDGKRFGASRPPQRFATREARAKAVAKYFACAEKRAAKVAAREAAKSAAKAFALFVPTCKGCGAHHDVEYRADGRDCCEQPHGCGVEGCSLCERPAADDGAARLARMGYEASS